METKTVKIPNIGCMDCVGTITSELCTIDGVVIVAGNSEAQTIVIRWHEPADWEAIKTRLVEIEYPPAG